MLISLLWMIKSKEIHVSLRLIQLPQCQCHTHLCEDGIGLLKNLTEVLPVLLSHIWTIFVRDGILSVTDYNSTRVGVVVVVVVVVVTLFCNGIT